MLQKKHFCTIGGLLVTNISYPRGFFSCVSCVVTPYWRISESNIYLPQLFDLLFKSRLWGQLYVLPYFILCFSVSAPKSFLLILFPLPCMSGVIGLREAKQALPCSQLGMHSLAPVSAAGSEDLRTKNFPGPAYCSSDHEAYFCQLRRSVNHFS